MTSRLGRLAVTWIRPVLTAAVVELIVIAGTAFGPARQGKPADLLALALLVIAAGAVGFVRRWPVPSLTASLVCTAAYYGLGYHTDSSFFIGLLVTAYYAGRAERRMRTVLFAVAVAVLFTVAMIVRPATDQPGGIVLAALTIGALVVGQAVAEWRAGVERQAEEAREEHALRRIAEERLRIARELHDVVSHSIAMINVQASSAVHVMHDRPDRAQEALIAIKAASRDALTDLRGILGLLRQLDDAEPRSPAGGLDEVSSLVESIRRAGVEVTLSMEDAMGPVPTPVDLAAYRVIQEALTNVVRHAPGAAAAVTVRRVQGALEITVEDSGRARIAAGGDGRQGAGHGIVGMRERVRAVGGSIDAGPRDSGGFAVRATLPVSVAAE